VTILKRDYACKLCSQFNDILTTIQLNQKIAKESTLLKDLDIIEVGSVKLQFSAQEGGCKNICVNGHS